MNCPGRLGYTGLYIGNLRPGWDIGWHLPEGVRHPKGNLGSRACYSLPQLSGYRDGCGTCCCLPRQMFGLAGGYEDCYLPESGKDD